MERERQHWIDVYKGIAILLVVLGHVAGGARFVSSDYSFEMFQLFFKVIYLFHMPAFFFLAGMTWSAGSGGFFSYAKRKFNRLMIPYFCFGVLSVIVFLMLAPANASEISKYTIDYGVRSIPKGWWVPFASLLQGGGWPAGRGFACNSVLWFLPCLFSLLMIYYWIDKLSKTMWVQLPIAGVMWLCASQFPHGFRLPWGMSAATSYLVFFILGRLWNQLRFAMNVKARYIVLGWLAFAVAGIFLPYTAECTGRTYVFVCCADFVLAVSGCVLLFLSSRLFSIGWLESIGRNSLGVMLVHKFPVIALTVKCGAMRSLFGAGMAQAFVACCLVTVLSVVSAWIASCLINKYVPSFFGGFKHG